MRGGTPTAPQRSTSVGARLRGWAHRYLAAEVAGYLGAVFPAVAAAHAFGGSLMAVAIAATVGETVAFYGVFLVVQVARGAAPEMGPWWRRLGALGGRLLVEFGPAEAVDTVAIRPAAMYLAPMLLGHVVPGVLVGKVAADIVFFGVTVLSYELFVRRRERARARTVEIAVVRMPVAVPAGSATVPIDDADRPDDAGPPPVEPAPSAAGSGPEGVRAVAGPARTIGRRPAGLDESDPFGTDRLPDPPVAPATPYLTIDLGRVTTGYTALIAALPGVTLAYPLAANAAPDLIRHVGMLGVRFVARSLADVRALGRMGVRAADVRLDVSVLPWWHVRDLHGAGMWRFRVDSAVELAKIARYAPGAAVVVPVALDGGPGGVTADQAYELLVTARAAGLRPWGLACRATDPAAWETPVAACAVVMNRLSLLGVTMSSLDLDEGVTLDTAPMVMSALRRHLPYPLAVAVSVGRALVAGAGTITATVTGLAWRAGERWVHLDVGARNGGAAVAADGSATPLALSDARGGPPARYRVTGPVGDGPDALGVALLSADLAAGDAVLMRDAGAYTASAAAPVNGHPVPVIVCTLRAVDRAPADAWTDWADWSEWEPAGVARGGLAGLAATLAGARVTTDATTGGWRRRTAGEEVAVPAPRAGDGPAVPDTGGRSTALRRSRLPATVTIPADEQVFDPDAESLSA